eukprot:Stramenopile-MAST_4_protein_6188
MDLRGVPFRVLQDVRDRLDAFAAGERVEYQQQTGVRLPNNNFQRREYDALNVLVRTETRLSDAEWATVTTIRAAVGDRVVWNDSGVKRWGAVVMVVHDEYVVRPAKTPDKFHQEINHAHWDWGDEAILRELERDVCMTTKDACEEIVKHDTLAARASYVDHLALTAAATKFVSHAWKYTFRDIVTALETTMQTDDVLWFDICTVNQHQSETRDFDWWQTTFQGAVGNIGCTVLVLFPWEKPIPLTRSWCIWEVFSTLVTNARLEVVMSDTDRFL